MTNLSKTGTAAPALADLLSQPTRFFEALRTLPPSPARYLWLVALTGVVFGIASTLLSRNVLLAQTALQVNGASGGGPSPLLVYSPVIFSVLFGMALAWLVLWGLGTLGAGKEGRAAEVAGVTFLPMLIWAVVLLPVAAFFAPEVRIAPPNLAGLKDMAAQQATLAYSFKLQDDIGQQPISRITTYLGYAVYLWQAWLAFIGFRVMTGNQARAIRGVLIPVAVFIVLGVASLLIVSAGKSLLLNK